ncbi:MAG: hypothetical protein PHV02_01220 [Rhodocyclaceae bacterium]|nr:hypothetical protein [Rhodocyclaceae bacterium]
MLWVRASPTTVVKVLASDGVNGVNCPPSSVAKLIGKPSAVNGKSAPNNPALAAVPVGAGMAMERAEMLILIP